MYKKLVISFYKILLAYILFVLSLYPLVTQAEEEGGVTPVNVLSCESLVAPGNISASFSSQVTYIDSTKQKVEIPIDVTNRFGHSVYDLNVYVAIYDNVTDSLVDVVTIGEALDLEGRSSETLQFQWDSSAVRSYTYSLRVYFGHYSLDVAKANASGQMNANATHQVRFDVEEDEMDINFSEGVVAQPDSLSFFDNENDQIQSIEIANNTYGINTVISDAKEMRVALDLVNQATSSPVSGEVIMNIYQGLFPHPSRLVSSENFSIKLVSGGVKNIELDFVPEFEQYQIELVYSLDSGQENIQLLPVQIGNPTTGVVSPLAQITYLNGLDLGAEQGALVGCVGTRTYGEAGAVKFLGEEEVYLEVQVNDEEYALVSDVGDMVTNDIGFELPLGNLDGDLDINFKLVQNDVVVDSYQTQIPCSECGEEEKDPLVFFGINASDFVKLIQYLVLIILVLLCGAFLYSLRKYLTIKKKINYEE